MFLNEAITKKFNKNKTSISRIFKDEIHGDKNLKGEQLKIIEDKK